MSFLDSHGTKRRLGQLAGAWERLRPFVEAEPSGPELDVSEDAFLALKKEIGQSMAVLHDDFGSSNLNREAELTAAKVRTLLTAMPSVGILKSTLTRDPDGVQRAWHAVFLALSELQGAKPPKAQKMKPMAIGMGMGMPMSGEPRYFRRRWHVTRTISQAVTFGLKVVAFAAVLAIALFFAERSGLFGRVDPASGQQVSTANAVLARVGQAWQSAQQWLAVQFPDLYNTVAGFYTRDPGTGVVILVMIAGIFVGYLLFIRTT